MDELRTMVETEARAGGDQHPRWVRVNALKTNLDEQLESTFLDFERVESVRDVFGAQGRVLFVDGHIPNLVAVSPGVDLTRTDAYKSGTIILQDKASCFPAYLLDPREDDGDIIDSCAAPGNKTTHLAAIIFSRKSPSAAVTHTIHAFEKDNGRAQTLDRLVKLAGSDGFTKISHGQDFLRVDPYADAYCGVGALLLDPSCSGSGIVGRDDMPDLHLPDAADAEGKPKSQQNVAGSQDRKRKRGRDDHDGKPNAVIIDDNGEETVLSSESDLSARLEALSTFQLVLLLHAFNFPAARKITYSTCSVHAEENENVVLKALDSETARQRGWKILARDRQVRGMREWPIRGSVEACGGDEQVAEACIRTYKDDGHGVMGFFVAGFVREEEPMDVDDEGPYVRDEHGRIVRDPTGLPTLKSSGVTLTYGDESLAKDLVQTIPGPKDDDGPFLRDSNGIIVRDADGMPALKPNARPQEASGAGPQGADTSEADASDSEWDGFDD